MKERIQSARTFSDIQIPEYEQAWNEWTQQLKCIDKEADKLSFLRTLVIDTDSPGLEEIQQMLIDKIKSTFQTTDVVIEKKGLIIFYTKKEKNFVNTVKKE